MGEAEKQPWTKPLELKDEYGNDKQNIFQVEGNKSSALENLRTREMMTENKPLKNKP